MKHPPSFSGDCLASCIQNNLPTDITAFIFGMIIAMAATIQLYQKNAGRTKKS